MKKFCISFIMISLSTVSFFSLAEADLLWSQDPHGWGKISAATVYHSWPADDFMLDTSSLINQVSWWGGRGGDTPVVDGFYIRFFSDNYDASVDQHYADQLLFEEYISGDAGQTTYNSETYSYTASLSSTFDAAANERYWLSIQADSANDPNNPWWGWQVSDTTNLDPAEYNSAHYSHYPITHWNDYDMAFELQGTPAPVPEPATLFLMASGLTGIVIMRKQKA